jgi:hypothetical protein
MGTDKRVIDESDISSKEPDWVCPYCDGYNAASVNVCSKCGAERETSDLNYFDMEQKREEKIRQIKHVDADTPADDADDEVGEECDTDSYTEDNNNFSFHSIKTFFKNGWKDISIAAACIAIIATVIFLSIPQNVKFTPQDFAWEREIGIEHIETFHESNWNLPGEARLSYTKQEISHYNNVLDHYETKTRQVAKQQLKGYETYVTGYRDLGNGRFEEITAQRPIYETVYETETYQDPVYRQEPVYATKYYYDIDRWTEYRQVSDKDNGKNPKWPEVQLNDGDREGTKREKYTVSGITEKNESASYTAPLELWEKLQSGSAVTLKISSDEIIEIK